MATLADEEELRRIIDESEALAPAQDDSVELPPRTVMLPPQGADLGVDTSKLAPPAPVAQPQQDDMELAYARAEDRAARRRSNNQGAALDAIRGLTGFAASPNQPVANRESNLLSQRRQASQDALRATEAGNNAARTAAYLDAQRLGAENAGLRLKAQQDEAARKTGVAGDRLSFDREKFGREQSEKERSNQANEATRKLLAAKKTAPKAPGVASKPDEVRFGSDTFVFNGDPATDKQIKLAGAKAVREKAAEWEATVAGLDQLDEALTRFVQSPTPQNKALLAGPALSAAAATNKALGQGAMSQDEKAAQFSALGVNMGDAAGIQALIERAFSSPEAAKDIVSRVKQMKSLARRTVEAQARPFGYDIRKTSAAPQGEKAAAPVATASPRKTATGANGEKYQLSADGTKWELME